MDPQALGKIMNSKTTETIAKQLWPSMLFVVVMSLISLIGARYFWVPVLDNQNMINISYIIWFVSMMVIVGLGCYVILLDARIQFFKKSA
ncbi:hypothetical protein SAMN05421743_12126 [Thalassobacillus cyri]|uniref:Uncharacterized protein n=2 Tax=Thalassobacillus cyri TaxID=571932 RepID=A0A1H4H1A1_9BACI|nr:hypothetical protein SAMN05421743_12126 [Thalassobacillus cyri]